MKQSKLELDKVAIREMIIVIALRINERPNSGGMSVFGNVTAILKPTYTVSVYDAV